MTNYILSDLTMDNVEKNEICFKLFWYKVFIHRKSKLLNFLVDSVNALVRWLLTSRRFLVDKHIIR